jgi:hypothetical protein
MNDVIGKLSGANMDIDLVSQADTAWKQTECPWKSAENVRSHRCALKNVSICPYFCGVEYLDVVLC